MPRRSGGHRWRVASVVEAVEEANLERGFIRQKKAPLTLRTTCPYVAFVIRGKHRDVVDQNFFFRSTLLFLEDDVDAVTEG